MSNLVALGQPIFA